MPIVTNNLKKLKTLLSKEQTKILETALILMLPALLTKITGQIFNLVLTSSYSGNDSRINQFFIANAIPELLTTVLMIGAVGTVIIPVLVSAKQEKGEEYFYRIYSSIINLAILIFLAFSTLLIIFADKFIPAAVTLVDSSIPPNEVEMNNIIWMMRALILPQLILGISVFISTGLNIYNRYILPQLSPLFYNIGRIVTALILLPIVDFSPWAIVIAAYFGSFFHMAIQIPLFVHLKIKYYFTIDFRDKRVREVGALALPRIVVLASDQIGFLINNFIALAFIAGPAALHYAKSLYLVIPSIFGYTFSYASYPTISKLFYEKDFAKIRTIAHKTINEIFFMALPFVVTLMVLRVPIIRLIYGIVPGTKFTLEDSYQVAWLMFFFSFGLIFITARWFLFSMFYAAKDTVIPSIVSIVSLVGIVLFSIIFTNILSYNNSFAVSDIQVVPGQTGLFETGTVVSVLAFILLTIGILGCLYQIIVFVKINRFSAKGHLINMILKTFTFALVAVLGVLLVATLDTTHILNRSEEANRAGIGGISLAVSVIYSIEFVFMLYLFSKTKFSLKLHKLARSITPKIIAAFVMLIFMYFTYTLWNFISYTATEGSASDGLTGSTTLNMLILTLVTVVPGFMIYYLVSLLLKIEELAILRKYLNPVFRLGGLTIPPSSHL